MDTARGGAGKRAWWTAALLGVGVLVNYFDRVNLAVAQGAMQREWGVGNIGFGYLSSAYSWTYAAMQLPAGWLLDRFGVWAVGSVAALLWSAASFGGAAAPGLRIFFASRLLLGVAEAPTFPANAKAVAAWFPPEKRGLPTAIFDAGAKLGAGIGVLALGWLLVRHGWRWSFAATGAMSFAYFVLFAAFYRDKKQAAGVETRTAASPSAAANQAPRPIQARPEWDLDSSCGRGKFSASPWDFPATATAFISS